MITISSFFLISTILACCHGGETIDYRLLLNPTAEMKECTGPGLFCESCTSLVECLRNSNDDGWQKVHIATCDKEAPCVRDQCSPDNIVDPVCSGAADLKFVCNATGSFPDPFYCNKYVMCTPYYETGRYDVHVIECPPFTQYNYRTCLCDIEISNNQCPYGVYPVPLCEKAGQNGPLQGRESSYYICKPYDDYTHRDVLYPFQSLCSGTDIYRQDYGCHDKYGLNFEHN